MARKSNLLFNEWIKDAGGEICGIVSEEGAQGQDEQSLLKLDDACVRLDSRLSASSSGAMGEQVWRDVAAWRGHETRGRPGHETRGRADACVKPARVKKHSTAQHSTAQHITAQHSTA